MTRTTHNIDGHAVGFHDVEDACNDTDKHLKQILQEIISLLYTKDSAIRYSALTQIPPAKEIVSVTWSLCRHGRCAVEEVPFIKREQQDMSMI